MVRWSGPAGLGGRPIRSTRVRVLAAVAAAALGLTTNAPAARALPATGARGRPTVRLHGYAQGPVQRNGTAAGRAHRVPASATRAHPAVGTIKGHRAPKPDLAPPPVGTRPRVRTGSARMAPGREVADHRLLARPSAPPKTTRTTS